VPEPAEELKPNDRLGLKLQRIIACIAFPLLGSLVYLFMRWIMGYRIQHLREFRRRYHELISASPGPVVICANHLTKIDSLIINWSLASVGSHLCSFRSYPWNLPERARYANNIFLRLVCYLGSCIPVDRGGDRDAVKNSLNKLIHLLKKDNTVTIFPEGQRSRTGQVDTTDFSYGVGRLVKAADNCKVVCIYLRGYHQEKHSSIPRWGERFYVDMAIIKPQSIHTGVRGTRDIATQIVHQLAHMEKTYFAASGQ